MGVVAPRRPGGLNSVTPRVAVLEQLLEARLALGAHAEVVGQRLIDEHPYRERLRAQLTPAPLTMTGRMAAPELWTF